MGGRDIETKDQTLHFIGGGNMATAIISGYEKRDGHRAIVVCDPSQEARQRHEAAGRVTVESMDHLSNILTLVLGFKPQHFSAAIAPLKASLGDSPLVISMMVGVSCDSIEKALGPVRVVRIMPNTPMAIGQGMTAIAPGAHATDDDLALATELCGASGKVLQVEESRIDAVAAVSGSGPAYFFRFCEALMDAAVHTCGFSEEEAKLLVSQTAQGAIAYLGEQEGFPAAKLREEVTSKGGTTEAALRTFNEGELDALVGAALKAAMDRAEELNSDVDEGN